jgi:PQQ-like domain
MRRMWRASGGVAAASMALVAACGGHASAVPSAGAAPATSAARSAHVPSGDWMRFNYDASRSGVGPADTGITAGNVKGLGRRVVRIDGAADSSAVELHGIRIHGRKRDVAVFTTTYGKTIAIDVGTGRRLWEFTPSDIRAYQGGHQITTATPVVDPNRRYVYATSPDGLIRKLVLSSGREVRSGRWPARITFDPTREKIAPALNLTGHDVVAVTGGYFGDAPTYQGHVVLIDRSSGRIDHVWNSLCSDRHYLIDPPSSCPASDSAIWARAGAVIEPGSGRILVATGNGPFNGSTNWGDSVLELAPDASQLLQNWTPTDEAQLNANDTDLGSTAPALLPGGFVVQGGKAGRLDLLNLARLNGTTGGAGSKLGGELQSIGAPGGGEVLTAPAVWTSGGRTLVFVADDNGTEAYSFSGGHLSVAWNQDAGGTSPVIAGGLLYVYDEQGGKLNVRDPATGNLIASLPAAGGHWNSPIVVGGRVVLPVGGSTADNASSGLVYIYHLRGR